MILLSDEFVFFYRTFKTHTTHTQQQNNGLRGCNRHDLRLQWKHRQNVRGWSSAFGPGQGQRAPHPAGAGGEGWRLERTSGGGAVSTRKTRHIGQILAPLWAGIKVLKKNNFETLEDVGRTFLFYFRKKKVKLSPVKFPLNNTTFRETSD